MRTRERRRARRHLRRERLRASIRGQSRPVFVLLTLGWTVYAVAQIYSAASEPSPASLVFGIAVAALALGIAAYNLRVRFQQRAGSDLETRTEGVTGLPAPVAVIAMLLLVSVMTVLTALNRPSAEPSAAVQGRQAARRIARVLATGDLDPPTGSVRHVAVSCDRGSGEPGLVLTYGGRTVGRMVVAQLKTATWAKFQPGDQHSIEYQRLFEDWVASLNNLDPAHGHRWSASLLVGSDLTVDCSTYSREVGRVLRRASMNA
jgi:hypothetical protein